MPATPDTNKALTTRPQMVHLMNMAAARLCEADERIGHVVERLLRSCHTKGTVGEAHREVLCALAESLAALSVSCRVAGERISGTAGILVRSEEWEQEMPALLTLVRPLLARLRVEESLAHQVLQALADAGPHRSGDSQSQF